MLNIFQNTGPGCESVGGGNIHIRKKDAAPIELFEELYSLVSRDVRTKVNVLLQTLVEPINQLNRTDAVLIGAQTLLLLPQRKPTSQGSDDVVPQPGCRRNNALPIKLMGKYGEVVSNRYHQARNSCKIVYDCIATGRSSSSSRPDKTDSDISINIKVFEAVPCGPPRPRDLFALWSSHRTIFIHRHCHGINPDI